MSPGLFLVVVAALAGLSIGSFLNVVICRVPAGQSVVRPPSACPRCGAGIRPLDNIPILSWLLLRGRCRSCRTAISPRYAIVEALTAAVFVLVAVRFGLSPTVPTELIFVSGLIALAFCDLERMLLPRRIVLPTLTMVSAGLVVTAAAEGTWRRLLVAVACSLGAFAVFRIIHLANHRWMGYGDVRLAPVIGLALGWTGSSDVIYAFLLANAIGALTGIILIALHRANRRTALPFGVFLSLGAVIALAAGPWLPSLDALTTVR